MFQTQTITDLTIEPVSLQEVKDFMEIDFNDFDVLITRLLKAARVSSEKYTGLSYGKKKIALVSDQAQVNVPLGPYKEFFSLVDKDGNPITLNNYSIFGFANPIITVGLKHYPNYYDPYYDILGTALLRYNQWTLTYYAGYYEVISNVVVNTLPEDLKTAICMRVETAFKYRADTTNEQVNQAINTSTDIEFSYRVDPMI